MNWNIIAGLVVFVAVMVSIALWPAKKDTWAPEDPVGHAVDEYVGCATCAYRALWGTDTKVYAEVCHGCYQNAIPQHWKEREE